MNVKTLLLELTFKAVKSSGSGGQHVNKVASKIELHFNLLISNVLTQEQKALLLISLKNRLTNSNAIILQCDESRSQHKNKALVIKRFIKLIEQGLIVPKKRVVTKAPKRIIKKRLDNKSKQSEKKVNRKKPDVD